jgi:hypothetical protein
MYLAMREFYRVLRIGGKLILTFDYPIINLNYFQQIAKKTGFVFIGDFDPDLPEDAVYSKRLGLHCFRAVMTKII